MCGFCPTCGRPYPHNYYHRPWQWYPPPWPGYPRPYVGDPLPAPYWGTGNAVSQAKRVLQG